MTPDSIRSPAKNSANLSAGISRVSSPFTDNSVSLLINFESCADPLDWTRGVHGIRIVFPHPQSPSRRRLSATYLPDVCTDQGWTKDECLESLMRKAGYDPSYSRGSKEGGWRSVQGLKVERYRALKGRISHDGYVEAVSELGKLN
jgi:AMME syndrome candidate gene 1 protein